MSEAVQGGSVGTFTTDRKLVITSWNDWMEEATGIPAARATGHRIDELYPELTERGITRRMERVVERGIFEVMAPAFHKYVIPCPPREPSPHFARMRQFVVISPLTSSEGIVGLSVTVEDVTPRLERERELLAQLQRGNEEARLRAASTLAAASKGAGLLADAITDPSWRVRRVSAAGLAATGGTQATAALIEAMREHHGDPSVLSAALTAIIDSKDDLVGHLLQLVHTDDADLRTYVALALGLIGDPRPVPALLGLLDDTDTNVRYHAIEALGRIADRSAAEPLVKIAEQRDFFLSFAAIDALAAIGEPSVAARLVPLLEDPELGGATATCLGAIGTEDVVAPLALRLGVEGAPVSEIAAGLTLLHRRVREATGEERIVADIARNAMNSVAADALLAALGDATETNAHALLTVAGWLRDDRVDDAVAHRLTDPVLRDLAAQVLAARGARAVPALLAQAPLLDAEGQKLVAMALARIGSPDGVHWLVERLRADPPVAIAAAGALGSIGDRKAFEPLLAVLEHPNDAVRRAAVGALNSIGHPEMEDRVCGMLRHPSPRVRESAARIAGYFGYASCADDMLRAMQDADEVVRRSAVEHAANLEDDRVTAVILGALAGDDAASVRAAAARALAHHEDPEVLAALLRATSDRDLWVRYYAVRAITRRGDAGPQVAAALRGIVVSDAPPPLRIAAAEAMAELRDTTFVEPLRSAAAADEAEVVEAALRALGAFPLDGTRDVIAAALTSDDPARQAAALAAVTRQRSDEWIPKLRALAGSGSAATSAAAVAALRDIGTAPAVAALVQLAESMRLRRIVLNALSTLDVSQVEAISDALAYENEGVRCMVVEALGRMKHAAAAPLLVAALDDPSSAVRLAATQALSRLDLRSAKARMA